MQDVDTKTLNELQKRKVKLSRFEVKIEFPMSQSLMFSEQKTDAKYFRSYFVVYYLNAANNEVVHKLFATVVLIMDYIIQRGFNSIKIYPTNSTKDTLEFTFSFKTIEEYLEFIDGYEEYIQKNSSKYVYKGK